MTSNSNSQRPADDTQSDPPPRGTDLRWLTSRLIACGLIATTSKELAFALGIFAVLVYFRLRVDRQ